MTIAQRMTVQEFKAFIRRPENVNRRFELIDGEIVEKVPTFLHAKIQGLIITLLNLFLFDHPIAHVLPEIEVVLPDDNDNERVPDVGVVLAKGHVLEPNRGLDFVPELVVEIQSPSQSDAFMRRKADYFLANGARIVWIVYPRLKLVEVLAREDRVLLGIDDTLTGGDVLPGFTCPVSRIFPTL